MNTAPYAFSHLFEISLLGLAALLVLLTCLWLLSLWLEDVSIIDIAWGPGFMVVGWTVYFFWQAIVGKQLLIPGILAGFSLDPSPTRRGLIAVVLTSIWGLRLAAYLAWRNLGKGEDYRYRAMRAKYGAKFRWISLGMVFWLQGLLVWIVSIPLQAAIFSRSPSGWLQPGVLVWAVGMFFETVGDFQLARFKADPANRGRVMDRGLWRYTRHPNYFGDFLVWWGIYLLALGGGAWWSFIGPAVMTVLLLRVSGVSLLEASLKQRREGYDDYIRRTSAFFPRPPRDP